jgi:hypothetical protein
LQTLSATALVVVHLEVVLKPATCMWGGIVVCAGCQSGQSGRRSIHHSTRHPNFQ